jgi:hypothetical protein
VRPVVRSLISLALLCALALGSPFASAQSGASPRRRAPLGETLSGPAKDAYEAAGILLNNRDFAGAVTKYRQAYDLSKDPRLLFNMAVCERDLRAYARMQGLLLRYELEAGADLSEEEKAEVDAALAAIHSLIATVNLTASEVGASVTIDGEKAGTTPLAAPLVVDLGKHTVAVKKPGFEAVEHTIEVAGGNEATVAITLVSQTRPAQLHVVAATEATVVVDRKEIAKGTFDGLLPPGAHQVQVSAPGTKTYDVQLNLGDGEMRTLHVTLESERRGLGMWPWVVGGAVLAAGAAVGGYFLFRQPQTERGPVPPSDLPIVDLNSPSGR